MDTVGMVEVGAVAQSPQRAVTHVGGIGGALTHEER